jgi:hypothetical protein
MTKLGRNVPLHGLSKWCYFCSDQPSNMAARRHNSLWLAEIFKDLLLRYYRRMELKIVMNDHCKLLTKLLFGYIYLYNILWSWYTSRPLGTPPYSICKWYHCIHVPVVVLGYKIHYRCRTTCMISIVLQYGKEMADIIANNIFHKKATVKACQPSRPKSCWNGPMMVIF